MIATAIKRRFEPVRCLGEGAMGVVYEAIDRERSTRVALKTLRHMTPESLVCLKREFRAMQDVHHHNLVSLGELVSVGDHWFFTMELVDGVEWLEYVRDRLSPEQRNAPTASATSAGRRWSHKGSKYPLALRKCWCRVAGGSRPHKSRWVDEATHDCCRHHNALRVHAPAGRGRRGSGLRGGASPRSRSRGCRANCAPCRTCVTRIW